MHRRGVVAQILTILVAGGASAAPITFNTALPVTQGEGIVRIQAKRFTFSDPTPRGRDLEVEALPLVAVYGAIPKLTLFGILPLVDKKLRIPTPAGRVIRQASGVGDLTLLARYTALQRDLPGRTLRIAPFLGIEAPTGKDDASDALGLLPRPLQPGSGSWDPLVGVVITRQTLAWQVDGAVSYKANTEADNFEFGDEARLDLSYQQRLWPGELGGGVPAFLYAVIDSNLIWRDRDRVGGLELSDSGGTTWYLAPGIQHVRKRLVLEAAIQLPLTQSLNGAALETDWIATLSTRVNF